MNIMKLLYGVLLLINVSCMVAMENNIQAIREYREMQKLVDGNYLFFRSKTADTSIEDKVVAWDAEYKEAEKEAKSGFYLVAYNSMRTIKEDMESFYWKYIAENRKRREKEQNNKRISLPRETEVGAEN